MRSATRRITLGLLVAVGSATCGEEPAGPPPPVARVQVLGPALLRLGQDAQFSALALDASGDNLPGRTFTWTSSNLGAATVDGTGHVVTTGVGVSEIAATSEGIGGALRVAVTLVPVMALEVSPADDSLLVGASLQLTAIPRDSAGGVIVGRPVVWAVSDSQAATITPDGLAVAHLAKTVVITAVVEGHRNGAFLKGQYPVASLSLPDSASVGLYKFLQIIPALRSSSGTPIAGRATTWTTGDSTIVVVSTAGRVSPKALGSTTIAATSEGQGDTMMVTVVPEPLRVFLLGYFHQTWVYAGDTTRMVVSMEDARGSLTPGHNITWISSDTTIATVAPWSINERSGIIQGLRPGRALISAKDGDSSRTLPIDVRLPPVRLVMNRDSALIRVGEALTVRPLGLDSLGQVAEVPNYFLTSSDTTVVKPEITASAFVLGRGPGRATVTGHTFNGRSADAVVMVSAPSNHTLRWAGGELATAALETRTVDVEVLRAAGQDTVPRTVMFLSSDTSVATVAPAAQSGVVGLVSAHVTGRRPGHAVITATTDSAFAMMSVQVFEVPISEIVLFPRPSTLRQGDTLRLTATTRGTDYQVRPYPVTWTTSDSAVATVSDSGLLRAIGGGTVKITASSGDKADSIGFWVESSAAPLIDSLSPLPLSPGLSASIFGTGFDPDPSLNVVTIDGVAALITSASPTRIDFLLPPSSSFPCVPTHPAMVAVLSAGRFTAVHQAVAVAPQRALSIGEEATIPPAEAMCFELARNTGKFVITIANGAPSADARAPIEVAGEAGQVLAAIAMAKPGATSPNENQRPGTILPDLAELRRQIEVHHRLLRSSRDLSRRTSPPGPLLRAAQVAFRRLNVTTDTLNGLARIRIPSITYPDFCARYTTINARRVFAGPHVVIFEDVAAPLASTMDALYQELGAKFEGDMYPTLLRYFGNPLALDSLLDDNGRLTIVFSPQVNAAGVGGFVVSCDFYPETMVPSSNSGETVYAMVPTSSATIFQTGSKSYWRWLIPTIVMHESKHLTAFAERLSQGAPPEDIWLEEATAMLAEEIWDRRYTLVPWKGNGTYQATLYCEVRPTDFQCQGRPYSMVNAFAFLYDYAAGGGTARHSPLGAVDPSDATFYGSGWSLLRWAVDQYATTEENFLTTLIREPTLLGTENLAARTGRPFTELARDWSLATTLDDNGLAVPRPVLAIPSWDTRSIFQGLNSDFPISFPELFPFEPRERTGRFHDVIAGLPGGSAATFRILGQDASQLLQIRSPTGGAVGSDIRIHIVRVQ